MKVLLDTHTFIWWDSEPSKLSPLALRLCQDPATVLLFSVASAWKIQIKLQLGKLNLNLPLADIIRQQQINGINILSVTLNHVLTLQNLPTPHKDPFDRLLVVQAIVEGAILLSVNFIFSQYPVSVLW